MTLAPFFNSAALAFSDIVSGGEPDTLYKVVSYVPQYDPNLNSALYDLYSSPQPYRKLCSDPQGNIVAKPFWGHISEINQFGTKPLAPGPASAFTSNFPAGVRVQLAILPETEFAKVRDHVGSPKFGTSRLP